MKPHERQNLSRLVYDAEAFYNSQLEEWQVRLEKLRKLTPKELQDYGCDLYRKTHSLFTTMFDEWDNDAGLVCVSMEHDDQEQGLEAKLFSIDEDLSYWAERHYDPSDNHDIFFRLQFAGTASVALNAIHQNLNLNGWGNIANFILTEDPAYVFNLNEVAELEDAHESLVGMFERANLRLPAP